jgi:ribosomal protein S18 acetylase RimI-like enzyme
MVVALDGGRIVGQVEAVVHRHPDKPTELYMDEVGVADAYRRRGIARRMLAAMLAHGKALGCEVAWVGTEPDNLAPRGLYEERRGAGEGFVMYVFKL